MQRLIIIILSIASVVLPYIILTEMFKEQEVKEPKFEKVANEFIDAVAESKADKAYALGGEQLKSRVNEQAFAQEMDAVGLFADGTVTWTKKERILPFDAGYALQGTYSSNQDENKELSVRMYVYGNEDTSPSDKLGCYCPAVDEEAEKLVPDQTACITLEGQSCKREGEPAEIAARVIKTQSSEVKAQFAYPMWTDWNENTKWTVGDFRSIDPKSSVAVDEGIRVESESFTNLVLSGNLKEAYNEGATSLRENLAFAEFKALLEGKGLSQKGQFTWGAQHKALPNNAGYVMFGSFVDDATQQSKAVQMHLVQEKVNKIVEVPACYCSGSNPDTDSCATLDNQICQADERLPLDKAKIVETEGKKITFSHYSPAKKEAQDVTAWKVLDYRVQNKAASWKKSKYTKRATEFIRLVSEENFSGAYDMGGTKMKELRTLEQFTQDMNEAGFAKPGTVRWEKQNRALPGNAGYKLMGTYLYKGTEEQSVPIYVHIEGNEHLSVAEKEHCFCPATGDPKNLKPLTDACVTYEGVSCQRKGVPTKMKKSRKIVNEKNETIVCAFQYPAWNQWNEGTKWSVLDYRSAESMSTRLQGSMFGSFATNTATGLDWFLLVCAVGLLVAFIGLLWFYIKGLWGSPRELYLMFFTKVTEYSAYGAASAIMVIYLQQNVLMNGEALGDSSGYIYYMIWGLVATMITFMVGAVCDTIGIKKCLMIGAVALIISRFFMPLTQDIVPVTILGFLPLAFGFAITGPVLKVGIKYFTTLKTATLGFGMFYTLMNVGFMIGAWLADFFRKNYSDGVDLWGYPMTVYQAIIFIGFLINIPDFVAILVMREGAEMTEKGFVIKEPKLAGKSKEELVGSVAERRSQMVKELLYSLGFTAAIAAVAYMMNKAEIHEWKVSVVKAGYYVWAFEITAALFAVGGVLYALLSLLGSASAGGLFDRAMSSVRQATEGTVEQLKENFQERPFWIYMAMLGILVFVRLTFYIFHVMFPAYAMRVFGDDFPIASIFGLLNPYMIVFLVPLISTLTINIRSYTMLIVGTVVSGASVFLCFLPDSIAMGIGQTWLGTWIFDYWLEVPLGNQDPFLVSLIVFIIIFTIGEAIWSPRLMQFSAEIAPKGKEGAYIALAILPYFLGKIAATIMADQLTGLYFSEDMVDYTGHEMAWAFIGGMALLSPLGMIVFRKTFNQSEKMGEEEAANVRREEGA